MVIAACVLMGGPPARRPLLRIGRAYRSSFLQLADTL